MADRIKGITVEIGGDTTGLSKALSGVNKEISSTQKELKDVERLLKLDPTNTELLRQKHELLSKQISDTKSKLETLREAERQLKDSGVDENSEQFRGLEREIIATEQALDSLETAASRSRAALVKISDVSGKISTGAGKIASATKGLSTAAGGALAGIAGLAYNSVTLADDLNTLAKQSGFTTAAIQKMQYASALIDVDMETIISSSARLTRALATSEEKITQYGIATRDAAGNLLSTDEIFYNTIQYLSTVRSETERDVIAMELFGKSANQLAGVIDDGGEALKNLGQQAEDLGLILDQETLDSLNAVNDQIDTLKANATATMAEVGAKALDTLMPVLENIIEKVAGLLEWIGNLDEGTLKMILTVLTATAAISPLAKGISDVTNLISVMSGTVIPNLLKVGSKISGELLPKITSGISAFMTGPHALILAGIVALVTLIVAKGDEIKEVISKVTAWIQDKLDKLMEWLNKSVVGTMLTGIVQTLKNAIESVKKIFTGLIDFVKGVFTGDWSRAWQGVVSIFGGIWDGIKAVAKAPLNAVIGMINGVIKGINKVKGFLGGSEISTIPLLAHGGILSSGSAIVGEAGPELLTMQGGRAVVQPLTNNTNNTANYGGININVYGAAGQDIHELADVIMDEMQAAVNRKAEVFS